MLLAPLQSDTLHLHNTVAADRRQAVRAQSCNFSPNPTLHHLGWAKGEKKEKKIENSKKK